MGIGRFAACVLVAGITQFAVGALFHVVVPVVAPTIPRQFANAALFRPWDGWTSTYMALHPWGFGVLFAAAYLMLQHRGGGAPMWRGGLAFGLGLFAVGSLPIFLLVLASMQVTPELIACWSIQNACQYAAAGAALGWFAARSA